MSANRVRVYIATSLDGFIAGPDGDLSWLTGSAPAAEAEAEPAPPEPGALSFEAFIAEVGAILMGRATYDAVRGFGVPWPYGELPVLVASTRDLDPDPPSTVRRVQGAIGALVQQAREAAGPADVYLDGGAMIRQAADARLIDEITITIAPVALGAGHALFAGLNERYPLEIVSAHRFTGGMFQIRAIPAPPQPS